MFVILQKMILTIRKKITLSNISKILLFTATIVLITSYLFYVFERKEQDITFIDGLWWGFATVTTVGYGDIFPVTQLGRIVATFLMVIGIGTFGLITASVATIFFDKMVKGESGDLKVNCKNHIIIFGYTNKTKSIIEEINNEDHPSEIVVISSTPGLKKSDDSFHFVNGEETSDETLEKANVKKASKVIILSDESLEQPQMRDAKSVLICLAVDKMNPDIHIVAEIADEKNLNHFLRANVDDYVITSQITSKIIARGAIHKHVSDSIKELTTNAYGNELYEKIMDDLKESIIFSTLANNYLKNYKCIIIGIVKNNKTILNPNADELINKEDSIIYISHEAI
ncbi:MAG: NAD-binding protein [Clostridiales bacterium]|nr:NAD-binding protein [Clostridiales bacterium]